MQGRSRVNTCEVLGVRFFSGSIAEAVRTMIERSGLLVVPAAPALVNIQYDTDYRRALTESDLAIADSGFMVLLWRFLQRERIPRISGLAYLQELLRREELRKIGSVFIVLPTESARAKSLTWLHKQNFVFEAEKTHVAPRYGDHVFDAQLVAILNKHRPRHVIVGLGGGVQEKLGIYLREALEYRPAIHCVGAALGFITGDQKSIPRWADRLYLGWLLRLLRDPRRYFKRFWLAHELPGLIWQYGAQLPPLRTAVR